MTFSSTLRPVLLRRLLRGIEHFFVLADVRTSPGGRYTIRITSPALRNAGVWRSPGGRSCRHQCDGATHSDVQTKFGDLLTVVERVVLRTEFSDVEAAVDLQVKRYVPSEAWSNCRTQAVA